MPGWLPVYVQTKAGLGSGFSDKEYAEAGAKITRNIASTYKKAEMIIKVNMVIMKIPMLICIVVILVIVFMMIKLAIIVLLNVIFIKISCISGLYQFFNY